MLVRATCLAAPFFVLLLSLPAAAFAQQWLPLGPYGADVRVLEVEIDGTLLAQTARATIYAWNPTAEVWKRADRSEIYRDMVAGPAGILYAFDRRGYVYRSYDTGNTWEEVEVEFPDRHTGDLKEGEISNLIIDSANRLLFATPSNGVMRSADDGETWQVAGASIQQRPVSDLLLLKSGDLYATVQKRLYQSPDQGQTWTDVHPPELPEDVLNLYQSAGGTLFALTYEHGVYRQEYPGLAWTKVSDIRAYGFHEVAEEGVLFMVSNDGVLLRSTDDGVVWTAVPALPFVNTIEVDEDGRPYAGTSAGVFRSFDAGGVWEPIFTGIPTRIGSLMRDAAGNIWAGSYRLAPDGATWEVMDTPSLPFRASQDDAFYAFRDTVLYRSLDNGITWNPHGHLEPPYFMLNFGISSLAAGPEGLMLGTSSGSYLHDFFNFINISTDGGRTWVTQSVGGPVQAIYITATGAMLFAVDGIIHRSTDKGQTWVPVADLSSSISVEGFAVTERGNLMLATRNVRLPEDYAKSGLYRSLDDGVTWTQLGTLQGESFLSLRTDDEGVLALTTTSRLYRISDEGRAELLVDGDESLAPISSFVNGSDGTIYVITPDGVLRSTYPIATATEPTPEETPPDISALQAYPTPFRARSTVSFNLGKTVPRATLYLYNVLGQQVATLLDEPLPSGHHQVELEADGFPAGAYFLRLKAGDSVSTAEILLVK